MRIVVLDSIPLDAEDDLNWAPLGELGDLHLHTHSGPETVAERIGDADIVITNKVPLPADVIRQADSLKLVSVLATGYNIVDVDAARERNVTVCNVPGYSTPATAQTTIALLLELCHHVGTHAAQVRDGEWQRRDVWSWWNKSPLELDGKTVAIVGHGAVGKRVGAIAEALGMTVVVAHLPGRPSSPEPSTPPRLPLDEALAVADVVSLHIPLTPETRGLMNAERLNRMKPTALLINAARGPLVDEADLLSALQTGQLAGYAADVLSEEPPPQDNPLLSAPNCLVTPHYAWASRAARERLLDATIENVRQFLAGTPQNVVT